MSIRVICSPASLRAKTISDSIDDLYSRLTSLLWLKNAIHFPFSPVSLVFILTLLPLLSDSLPQRYPLERYDSLRKHLPFGKPTTIETEAPKPPPFTEDLALLGFSKVGSGYFVTLTNKKTQQKIFLSPKEKPDGITVAEVINNPDLTKVEIKLKKGNEIASLRFDPAFLSGPKPGTIPIPMNANLQAPPIVIPQNSESEENLLPPPHPESTPSINTSTNIPTPQPPPIKRIRRVIVPPQAP